MLGVFAGAGQALPLAIGTQRLPVGTGLGVIGQKTEMEQATGRGDGMKRAGMNLAQNRRAVGVRPARLW